jgi:Photosynthesis system II assembly factor YCF48
MPSDDRERSFENALARHLRPDAPHVGCSDPETLAAYHERSLAPVQMASLQAHLSDCPRCQQILAYLQSTDEIPMPAANIAAPQAAAAKSGVRTFPTRRHTLWRWVAPAGALAAGLLVWVAVHENNSPQIAIPQLPGQAKPTEIANAQSSSTQPLPPPSADTRSRNQAVPSEALGRLDTVQPSLSKIAPVPQRSQSLSKEKDFLSAQKRSDAAGVSGALPVAPPKPANPAAAKSDLQPEVPGGVAQTVTVEAEAPNNELSSTQAAAAGAATTEPKAKSENDKRDTAYRAASSAPAFTGGAPVSAPSAPPQQSSQSVQVTAESAEITNLPVQNRQVANLTNLNAATQLLLASSTGGVTVSAPGGRVSWRIGQAGVILFSSDAGKTWLVQPSGIITDLLAGSAPSDKVCWIVGRSGTILRTTDKGRHWKKVTPPTQDDLRSVFAVDARQATVSPASGTYQTTDSGATWNKLPPE